MNTIRVHKQVQIPSCFDIMNQAICLYNSLDRNNSPKMSCVKPSEAYREKAYM